MSHQVIWTKIVVEEFVKLGNLTDLQEHILRTRAAGMTRSEQARIFHVSIRTVDNIIKTLKLKYDLCQKHSVILPPRKFSRQELYMDTH